MLLHFDFSTGASGDKILGALIELCQNLELATFEDLLALANKLLPNAAILQNNGCEEVKSTGIIVEEDAHDHRHFTDICDLIITAGNNAILSKRATQMSLDTFELIARAEAKVHNCSIGDVHFHEVGAADSIIDICCSSYLLDKLDATAIYASPLCLGYGSFTCSHGLMPVPAPATAELITNLPVFAGNIQGELTTPTGAALAANFVSNWQPLPTSRPLACGYGAGTKTLPGAANVVRVIAAMPADVFSTSDQDIMCTNDANNEPTNFFIEGVSLIQSNIDHISPEAIAFACEELLDAGALDVWQEPINMKKGRLAVRLCVLAQVDKTAEFTAQLMRLTGTLGVRLNYVERVVLARNIVTKTGKYGELHYKTAAIHSPSGQQIISRPEYEDVARIARQNNLDFNTLYRDLSL